MGFFCYQSASINILILRRFKRRLAIFISNRDITKWRFDYKDDKVTSKKVVEKIVKIIKKVSTDLARFFFKESGILLSMANTFPLGDGKL